MKSFFVALASTVMLASPAPFLAQTVGYKCVFGQTTVYQDTPCIAGQENTIPLDTPSAEDQVQARQRLERDQKRADAFVERVRKDNEKMAERRHELTLQEKKLETARLKKEAAALERKQSTDRKSRHRASTKKPETFKATVPKS